MNLDWVSAIHQIFLSITVINKKIFINDSLFWLYGDCVTLRKYNQFNLLLLTLNVIISNNQNIRF